MTKKDRAADLRLRRHYGITLEEYNQVLQFQGGRCGICNRAASTSRNRFSVDHCHRTGLLRGVLCWHCNKALGVFKDKVTLLESSADYLKEPPMSRFFKKERYTAAGVVGSKKRAKILSSIIHKGANG